MASFSLARFAATGFVTILLAHVGTTQTFTVGGPRDDFSTIQEGIDSSPSGAIILVRPGEYGFTSPALVIDGKSTTIAVRNPARRLKFSGEIIIRNLAADQSVTLIGFDVRPQDSGGSLLVTNVDGTVWFEDCNFLGTQIGFFEDPTTIRLTDANDVIFVRSSIYAGAALLGGPTSGVGLDASNSSIHLFETDVVGGDARSSTDIDGFPGGPAILLDGSFLYAREATFTGGAGGYVGTPFGCANLVGGIGAPGLQLVGVDPEAFLVDIELIAGEGGGATPPCIPGHSGPPLVVETGTVSSFAGTPHGIAANRVVSAFDETELVITADEGEFVWFMISTRPMANFVAGEFGTEVIANSFLVPVGTVGPSGTLSFTLPPALTSEGTYPVGFIGERAYFQPLSFDSKTMLLGTPAAMVVRPPEATEGIGWIRPSAQDR